nr:radical SAM protein [Treponema sp.]
DAKKVYGIHFVDEALPPKALCEFARLNASEGNKLSYWGNVRFENIYSRDMADLLSYGGLLGVSGGIEIATGSGLDEINKGTDLNSIVSACCAFKEAGILVHAYMIYGYWQQSDLDTINSMETLRQLYAAGLLDSSFWHKFVLTRHSRIYDEWKNGMHQELKPIEIKNSGIFAKNGLHFEGENKSEKFGPGLNLALQNWMHGEGLNKSVGKWFNFKTPQPTIAPDLIEKAIALYEINRDKKFAQPVNLKKSFWLGGKILYSKNKFIWNYKGELIEETIPQQLKNIFNENFTPQSFAAALWNINPAISDYEPLEYMLDKIPDLYKILQLFRGQGLCTL